MRRKNLKDWYSCLKALSVTRKLLMLISGPRIIIMRPKNVLRLLEGGIENWNPPFDSPLLQNQDGWENQCLDMSVLIRRILFWQKKVHQNILNIASYKYECCEPHENGQPFLLDHLKPRSSKNKNWGITLLQQFYKPELPAQIPGYSASNTSGSRWRPTRDTNYRCFVTG